MGLDALDVSRVEAGFVLRGVDYFTARKALIERHASTPYELGFDWMVQLEREPFVGQAALRHEHAAGPVRRLVGLEIDWDELEALHARWRLPPHLPTMTSREGVPVYSGDEQVGQATSRAWSPMRKQYLALATVRAELAEPGSEVAVEVTVEYERKRAKATVRPTPFYDPPRKKASVLEGP
jgi:aminomethyltransferase